MVVRSQGFDSEQQRLFLCRALSTHAWEVAAAAVWEMGTEMGLGSTRPRG